MKKRFSVLAAAAILSLAACTSAKEYVPPETMEWRRNGEKITLTLDSSHDVSSTSTAANGIVFQSVFDPLAVSADLMLDLVQYSVHGSIYVVSGILSSQDASFERDRDLYGIPRSFTREHGNDFGVRAQIALQFCRFLFEHHAHVVGHGEVPAADGKNHN